jgi:lysophospholipase L1-like esterase
VVFYRLNHTVGGVILNSKFKKILIISLSLNVVLILIAGAFVYKKGGASYLFNIAESVINNKQNKDNVDPYYLSRKSLFESLPYGSQDIIFLGDSITNRNEWTEFYKNPNIKNRGIDNDTVQGVFNRLDPILSGKPNKIFLMIGTNDLWNAKNDVAALLKNYKLILGKIQKDSPNTKIYVESILPINPKMLNSSRSNNEIQTINKELTLVSNEIKANYIDLYNLFTDQNGNLDEKYTNDGLHLNGNGYLVWMKAIESNVKVQ